MQLALVPILATRWRYLLQLQIWPPDGATCISCKFGQQMALLVLVPNLAIIWHHFLQLQFQPPMATLALVPVLATKWRHLHQFQSWPPGNITCIATLPWIALLASSVSIEFVSSSARVTSVKSAKGILSYLVRDNQIHRSDQGHLGPIKTASQTHVAPHVSPVWSHRPDMLQTCPK